MYAIEENRTKVNEVEFTTFKRKVEECCTVLEAEAGTTGYTGGEGTRTFIRLDCKDGPILLDPIKDEDGETTGIVIAACCDNALSALMQALEFWREALTDQMLEADE